MNAIDKYLQRTGNTAFRPKAALVDMDGTLYDSMGNHADAWIRLARENGLKAERDEFFLFEGRTGASTINILFQRTFNRDATDEEKKSLYHLKTLYFRELPEVKAMPGALRLMNALKDEDIIRVLVTGSGQNTLLNRLSTDFPGIFSDGLKITSANVTHGKPHPEPYLKAMELAGVQPWEAVAIENAPLGVQSAADAGAFTVAVTTGPVPRQALIDAGADLVYESMEACAKSLPELLLHYVNPIKPE